MKRTLRIRRGKGASSRLERYTVDLDERATLLDALESIRTGSAPDLCFRHSCHHGSCGTCSVLVDGAEVLACLTNLEALYAEGPAAARAAARTATAAATGGGESAEPIVEPLRVFEVIADLAVDPARLFRAEPEGTSQLRESESRDGAALPSGIDRFTRFEDCIECGLCISACPVMRATPDGFMGPQALAALRREIFNRKERKGELLGRAERSDGVVACDRHFDCSRVCPRGVYPGKHIELLRKEIAAREKGG
jgi:succinate dehydrogenase / fumarate reductase iron-sulfur subunit